MKNHPFFNSLLGLVASDETIKLPASTWRSTGNTTNSSTANVGLLGRMSVLTSEKFVMVLNKLGNRKDVEFLAEPEVTTLSGRQTQMRATQMQLLDPDSRKGLAISGPAVSSADYEPEPLPDHVEFGPVLDLLPEVLADGRSMRLTFRISLTEWTGTIQSTNVPPKYLPIIRGWQTAASVKVQDGQTVVVGGLTEANDGAIVETAKSDGRKLLVFITATLVDARGKRIHADDEMPFAQKGIPPQPDSKTAE